MLSRIQKRKHALAALALATCAWSMSGHSQDFNYKYADLYLSSNGGNQLMHFSLQNGKFLGVLQQVQAPVASQIGFDGDLFLSASGSGQVLRFDGFTGAYKGIFIDKGNGGMVEPSAPNFGPDNLVYVGDSALNAVLRYDRNGKFIDVFADHASSGLTAPYMNTFDETTMFICSGGTNSVLRFDLKTKKFLGAFVAPGSGGMIEPIGLEFGPDGNLYAGSSGTNAILRYNGKTGAFMDAFVPPGYGGLSNPHGLRFGGPNSNLYVVSTGNEQVLEYDRVTGKFLGVVADGSADGLLGARGLTFTPLPVFNVYAHVGVDVPFSFGRPFKHVHIEHSLNDYTDASPRVKLLSITSTDKSIDIAKAVQHARLGEADYDFDLEFSNKTGIEQHYTVTYIAANTHHLTKIATTEVDVPPEQ